ncbi:MAG: DUF5011 domain-containing protein, partial [Mariprofundus sp.]
MKRLSGLNRLLLWMVSLLLLMLSGCGGGGGGSSAASLSSVTLSFDLPATASVSPTAAGGHTQLAMRHMPSNDYTSLADFLIPSAFAIPVPVGIAKITIDFTGPGMTPMRDVIAVKPGMVSVTRTYNVPSGPNRTVTIAAIDAANVVLYQGSTLLASLQGATPITVPMAPTPAVDATPPVVKAPAAITVAAVDGTGTPTTLAAIKRFLGAVTASDNVGVVSLGHDAPARFPVGKTLVTFTAVDALGNSGTATSTVTVSDQQPPLITRSGAASVVATLNKPYIDGGATAADNVDGDISAKIATSNPVNTSVTGLYTVTYNVSDAAGNAAVPVTRSVLVNGPPVPTAGLLSVIEDSRGTVQVIAHDPNAGDSQGYAIRTQP